MASPLGQSVLQKSAVRAPKWPVTSILAMTDDKCAFSTLILLQNLMMTMLSNGSERVTEFFIGETL